MDYLEYSSNNLSLSVFWKQIPKKGTKGFAPLHPRTVIKYGVLRTFWMNGEYRGDDPIGRLMNDFSAVRADTMNNKELAERMTFLKDTENGRREFSGLGEMFFEEGIEKGIKQGKEQEQASVVLNLLKSGYSHVTIATACKYPESEVKDLRDRFIKEGLLPTT